MFILKPIIFLIAVFVLFILGRFYMLPIYLPLDTKPQGDWTASYLAKSIASDAGCTIDFFGDGIFWKKNNTTFAFYCTMPSALIDFDFEIYAFVNKKLRDTFLTKKDTSSNYHSYCFKKGSYYVVCRNVEDNIQILDPYDGKEAQLVANMNSPIVSYPLSGKQFYQQFPGEDINITIGY